jgi:hypothetical protein
MLLQTTVAIDEEKDEEKGTFWITVKSRSGKGGGKGRKRGHSTLLVHPGGSSQVLGRVPMVVKK